MKTEENLDKFILHRNDQIVQTLHLLAKNKCLINARFDSGKYSLLTVVIDVLKDKNTVVLDYGPNEAINKKLLSYNQRIVFTGVFNGIRTQFSAERVTQAKFKGNTVFATPIPDSLLWLERREYYRIKVPLTDPVKCQITLENNEVIQLDLLDIGMPGLALMDQDDKSGLPSDIEIVLPNCQLRLPESTEVIDLRICYQTAIGTEKASNKKRIGCSFVSPSHSFQSNILKFMQFVERQKIQLDH